MMMPSEKKVFAVFSGLWLLAGAVVLCGGCRSEAYYQDRAVQRAREYLLDNAPELTNEQLYFVKYNRPLLLTGEILSADGPGSAASQLKQICVTWRIPGQMNDFLVFGASSGSMRYWYPTRLIRKTFQKFSLPIQSAMTQARAYAQNYLYERLSVAEFNRIRFDFPYVLETTFEPMFDPSGTLEEEEIEQLQTALEAKTQLALMWELGDAGQCAVFCGYGEDDLKGWAINFGGIMPRSEVDAVTVEVLKTPDNVQTPIELPEELEETEELDEFFDDPFADPEEPGEEESSVESECEEEEESSEEAESSEESETTEEAEITEESETLVESESPAESETAGEEEFSPDSEAAAELESPAESEKPVDSEATEEEAEPMDLGSPAESEKPVDSTTSVGREHPPAASEAPAKPENPAEPEKPAAMFGESRGDA